MTLRHIRIFLAVCENGNNTTRAARALYQKYFEQWKNH